MEAALWYPTRNFSLWETQRVQLARYNKMHKRVLQYTVSINNTKKLANKQNLSRHKVDIIFFLLAYIYSLLAA